MKDQPMRNLIVPSVFAIALVMSTPAFTEEDWDERDYESEIDDDSAELGEEVEFEADEETVGETASDIEEVASADPEILREEAAAFINLRVFDVQGKRVGVVANVVMKDDAADLVIVKLDNVIPSNRLLRAVSFKAASIEGEGWVVLTTLTKSELRRQSPFLYEDVMDTIAPVTKSAERSDQQSES